MSMSGIKSPKDLIGKRVGGTNFQPAGNIWLRGILEEHYGVPHQSITWVVDRSEDVEFTPPPGLKIEMIPQGKHMDTMLAEGEIPAMINPYIPRPIVNGDPRVARLFPDYKQVERDYFQQTGIFPIMHVTVMKQEIVEKYPVGRGQPGQSLREGKAGLLSTSRQPEDRSAGVVFPSVG